jgi:hypothetical protein
MSRVAPICCQMSIQGKIPNLFYPLVLKEVGKPIRPPTPRPTLRPTNPKPPSTASTPYYVKSPDPIPEEEAIMSQGLSIPPDSDYMAGGNHGPYHQPTLFDEEKNNRWPLLPTYQDMWRAEGTSPQQANTYVYHYCNELGY